MDISIETGMSRALVSVNGAGAALTVHTNQYHTGNLQNSRSPRAAGYSESIPSLLIGTVRLHCHACR
jgi:hypothetical protein